MDASSVLKFTLFTSGEATLAFRASSSTLVNSRCNCFTVRRACSLRPYSTTDHSGSKRRARGPVMAAQKPTEGGKHDEGRYKRTVDLPKTTFGLRANSVVREPEIQKLWEDNQVFQKVVERNTGATFTLHDGPPYANGNLHMGHALNKIMKDIINRYKLLQNHKIHFVPGWDCHGLPIELKGI